MSFTNPAPGGQETRTDEGVDWGNIRGNIVAVGQGVITNVYQGLSGFGTTVIERLTTGPYAGTSIYYAGESGAGQPVVQAGDQVSTGQAIAPGLGSGGIEVGFWNPGTGRAVGAPDYTYDGKVTASGALFRRLLSRAPAGTQPGGTNNTISLANLWIQAGGDPKVANTMAAIAMAESAGRVDAQNAQSGAAGLWQILPSAHPQYDVNRLLSDPMYNAQAAVAVYKSQGFSAWATYTNGAYQSFLAGASKDTVTYGGPNGGRVRPGSSGSGGTGTTGTGSPDVTTVLTAYESQYDKPGQPWGAGVIGGDVGTQGGLFGTGIPTPGDVWQAITGAVSAPIDAIKFLIWMFNPVHILRAVELMLGVLIMAVGLRSVFPSRGSPSLASTGDGIARVTRSVVNATPAGREIRMLGGRIEGRREGQVEHARLTARRASRAAEAGRDRRANRSS